MKFSFKKSVITVVIGISLLAYTSNSFAMPNAPAATGDQERMVHMRVAGLTGDRSQIPVMIKALQKPLHPDYTWTTLHALAQLGATEALPAYDNIIQKEDANPQLANYTSVEKARLLAEAAAAPLPSKARNAARLTSFLQNLGLTPASINTATASYLSQLKEWNAQNVVQDAEGPPYPVALFAMRELADMAYHDPYANFLSLPEIKQINFAQEFGSDLKMRLAPLSPEQRIAMLLHEIVYQKASGGESELRMQLLVDEGPAAQAAAASTLQDLKLHPERYHGRSPYAGGYGILSRIVENTDSIQVPQLSRNTTASTVPPNARVDTHQRGYWQQFAIGY